MKASDEYNLIVKFVVIVVVVVVVVVEDTSFSCISQTNCLVREHGGKRVKG